MNRRSCSPIALWVVLCIGWLSWGMSAAETAAQSSGTRPADKILVVLGDSLSAGFGVDPSEAWPARIQEK
ncbi:MAG: arylesterase, partial [Verrucomicrobia bacterium]|nr:arylesterase [Verrucomicrobiota bacterium]